MPFGLLAEETAAPVPVVHETAAQVLAGHETAQILDDHVSPRWFE